MRRLLALVLFTASAFAADITGTWLAQVQTDAGSGSPTFTFKQTGTELAGVYDGTFGKANLTGTVNGNKVEWSFSPDYDGEKIKMTYSGTLEGDSKMSGTAVLGTLGSATFTATKK